VQVEGLRIGMYTDNGYFPASPALRRAVEEAADALDERGATVNPFTPPNVAETVRLFLGVMGADGGATYKRLLGKEKPIPQLKGTLQGLYTPKLLTPVISRLMASRGQRHLAYMIQCLGSLSTGEYWELVEALNAHRSRFINALDQGNFDAILCPPFALPALTHGSSEHLFPAGSYAFMYNVIGTPAGVVSITKVQPGEESDRTVSKDLADLTARDVEQGSAGLPVGVQVVARHWREDVVLALMAALEEHFQTKPTYPEYPELAT
jgi:fatty acid amide hydrolase